MKKVYQIKKEFVEVPDSRIYGKHTDVAKYYDSLTDNFPKLVEEYASEGEARETWERKYTTLPTLSYHPSVVPYWLGEVYTLEAVTLDEDGEEIEWENLDIAFPEYPDYAKREEAEYEAECE